MELVTAPRDQKKYRVLFYHAQHKEVDRFLQVTALALKTYIDVIAPDLAARLIWEVPIQEVVGDDTLLSAIRKQKIDFLCTSHFIWNHNDLMQQLSRLREHVPPGVLILCGGPSIDVHINKEFFSQYPWVDYAVYGPGEKAFLDILSHHVLNQPLKAVTTTNCAWYDKKKNKIEVASFENIKLLQQSPFLANKTLFARMVQHKKKKHPAGFTLNYELTRGCPYSCTFCDWNGGLTNKVSRRKNTYKQEIDLFFQLGIAGLYLGDANVGQYDEDVDMFEYVGQQGVKLNRRLLIWGNFSKLNKKNNLKMYHIMFKYGIGDNVMLISMQDIDAQVLANIDRPDVGWDVHLSMAQEIVDTYPQALVICQLIYGLPGQTPDSWRNTLRTITAENVYPYVFINLPLPASPALYDPNYQDKFSFEYTMSNRILWQPATADHQIQSYSTNITKSCFSFSQHDLVTMNLLTGIYQAVTKFNLYARRHGLAQFDSEKIVDGFLASPQYQRYHENFYSNWIKNNNFFYTIDFGGRPSAIADEDFGNQLALDRDFHWWIRKYASSDWIQLLSTADAYRSLSDYFTGLAGT